MSGTLTNHPYQSTRPAVSAPATGTAAPQGDDRAGSLAPGAREKSERGRLRERWPRAQELIRQFIGAIEENDLLTYASAVSFQILTAIVPFLLFVLALTASLHLQSFWHKDLAPQLRPNVSTAFYTVISTSVVNVFSKQRLLWATGGGLLTLWQVSGAVRAVMGALNNVYCAQTNRTWVRRMWISFLLSIAVGTCFVLAIVCARAAPFFFSVTHHGPALATLGFLIRWGLAASCLFLAVGLLVHFAPATPQPWRWVSLGSVIVIGVWLITTAAFVFYIHSIASYDSIFGGLSVIVVLTAYLYLSAIVFLLGAQLDAMIRTEAKGTAAGAPHGEVCDSG